MSFPLLFLLLLFVEPILLSEESEPPKLERMEKAVPASPPLKFSESKALREIAETSGLSERAKIAVCDLERNCWHLRGDELPESPASLAKIPIAVALMHKVVVENISLETPIYVEAGNFTEDGSEMEVEITYPLWKILAEMLVHSSNIAPNQLIDYLGWDYINEVLEESGYGVTRIRGKFTGDSIVPENPGTDVNALSSDELTGMMVKIYNREHPGDNVLISLLKYQRDRELGFAALENSKAKWLGEKTGQNSLVIGTTLAMEVRGKTYILSAIDDGFYSDVALRTAIAQIADRLYRARGLGN
ncbi:serine hydrolase [Phormidium sp. CCY1219]|uniref:serine hydrolase n=1 Tax=Phormidium sp. CCY1219 TaxID=2886104 RepID=UPI002D1EFDAA|nr:serine hydrolase [Phormidium sp. CCY1219]MEB3829725.1 class A beta-lactamase-related serine hydrolase [Phormidium sp. CCY1219]